MFGQNLLTKGVLLFIIVLIFLVSLFPNLPIYVRSCAYYLFQESAAVCLSYQTRAFYSIESENIILKYLEKDRNIASFALETAEKFYRSASETLGYNGKGTRTLVVLYPDQDSLNRSFGWAGDRSAAGVYWAGSIRMLSPYALNNTQEESAERIKQQFINNAPLSHELTHLVVDRLTGGNYTRWLTEGLAQYIEEELVGFRLSEPPAEERQQLYPLNRLEGEYDSLENQVLVYWQSLQTVRYLVEGYGMEKMQELLRVLGEGIKIEKALIKVYDLSITELEDETKQYLKRHDYFSE